MRKTFIVEIVGYLEIEASDASEARATVKDKFHTGELTYENLSFDVEQISDEEEN